MAAQVKQPVCLIVIDGWGVSDKKEGNAIVNANTPVMSGFEQNEQWMTVAAHGLSVGLPDGLMGNSEVGHLNVGAGRIVYQDIVRIDLAVQTGDIAKNETLVAAFDRAKAGNGRIHMLGLVSDGGVHSHINHLYALIDAAKAAAVPNTYVHFFADGRDTKPTSAIGYAEQLLAHLASRQYGKIATCMGRYYAMDRDKRWERVQVAYEALVDGRGEATTDLLETIRARYAANETDEFLKPIIVNAEGTIQDGDTLIFFNYRSDRMREIVEAFGFDAKPFPSPVTVRRDLSLSCMTRYKGEFPFPVLFAPQSMDNVLAEWLAKKGIRQYHVAETEKYAHVTFFFNGGTEREFELEDRKMVPSPKVATYDLKPEMSAIEVGEAVAEGIASGNYPFVMCNFAPPDMVGHTGNYEKAILGVEATDKAIGIIDAACRKHGYVLFVTADHGNAEQMISETGGPHTAHTCNRVPFVMTSKQHQFDHSLPDAKLADVAPTVLDVMGLDVPAEMTGRSLLKK